MTSHKYAFEDLVPDTSFALGPRTVTADEIIEFAREFDPQPMHLSQEAGEASILGGLAASGWHTCGLMMRMMIDSYLLNSLSEGSPGIETMEWRKPVLAGDTLSGQSTVLDSRLLRSRPAIGIVRFRHELHNQHGDLICRADNSIMFRTRTTPEAGS